MPATDFAWLSEHSIEIAAMYAGKWIAVHDGKIIAVGDTATEVVEQADVVVPDGDFVLEAVEGEGDVIYAGL